MPIFKKSGIEPSLVAVGDQNIHKLYFGRIDMYAATELSGWGIIEKYYPEKYHEFSMSQKAIHEISGDIIFDKSQTQLISTFRKGLVHIKKNGTFIKILKKYFKGREIPDYLLNEAN
jgi:ABC-type amino acid transport substrate-binding protein